MKHSLRALSIRQPWADLILWGVKDVENRTWGTSFRGTLLIHAGTKVEWEAVARLRRRLGIVLPAEYRPATGAVLGTVELVDCVTSHASPFFSGPFGFTLRAPVRFPEAVLYPGRLGIFPVPREVLDQVAAVAAVLP
jgi:hypothetical protein